jgi:hypothetical protein
VPPSPPGEGKEVLREFVRFGVGSLGLSEPNHSNSLQLVNAWLAAVVEMDEKWYRD